MRYYYDLHIHTCLSPCADNDMTPNNVVGMAKLIGLDFIAVTDHNSCKNAAAVIKAAEETGLLVLPGMELTTSEDVHIVMLFPSIDVAENFDAFVAKRRMGIKNRPDIYGEQLVTDESDNVVGIVDELLITATDIGVYDAAALAEKFGGVAVPAHVDRESNGLPAVLGAVDKDMGFRYVELSKTADSKLEKKYADEGYGIIRNSDAHRLEDVSERENFLELDALTAKNIIDKLKLTAYLE